MGVFFFFVSKKERKKETQYNQPQSSMLMWHGLFFLYFIFFFPVLQEKYIFFSSFVSRVSIHPRRQVLYTSADGHPSLRYIYRYSMNHCWREMDIFNGG
jgi:hypothetical protein